MKVGSIFVDGDMVRNKLYPGLKMVDDELTEELFLQLSANLFQYCFQQNRFDEEFIEDRSYVVADENLWEWFAEKFNDDNQLMSNANISGRLEQAALTINEVSSVLSKSIREFDKRRIPDNFYIMATETLGRDYEFEIHDADR